MGNLRYSIIYAVIRPEISEQVSVGLIIVDGEQVDVRYSRQKLNALQGLFPEKEYRFVSRVVSQMKRNKRVTWCMPTLDSSVTTPEATTLPLELTNIT